MAIELDGIYEGATPGDRVRVYLDLSTSDCDPRDREIMLLLERWMLKR